MIEGSGSGSMPLTNGSGSVSRRPKNIRIRIRIRIRNTAVKNAHLRWRMRCRMPRCWRRYCACSWKLATAVLSTRSVVVFTHSGPRWLIGYFEVPVQFLAQCFSGYYSYQSLDCFNQNSTVFHLGVFRTACILQLRGIVHFLNEKSAIYFFKIKKQWNVCFF